MHNLIKKWKSDERVDEKKTEADGTQALLVLSEEAMVKTSFRILSRCLQFSFAEGEKPRKVP